MYFVDVFYFSGKFGHLNFLKIEDVKNSVSSLESDVDIGCIKVFDDSGIKIYETNAIDWLV